ncbi:zinc ABC transporter substrate-binding protein [Rhizobium calliandrae]|uniref:Zinc ABC transporter substrate-binding protein n=1 Tax=Rhizobium calliandrae TaxID=1312182 RepID=A0ABT7KNR2_9HYPH|nr:zinc ABC transporter substrate-binding protein [Rhizobium calliandrae]MDL2410275.1 zinc ABC transporter substrate-binding protein [Rhizobium calliandrae]
MKKLFPWLGLGLLLATTAQATDPITIVAAENFYGDVAQQIAGPEVTVSSILSNPDQDPHEFEASPSVARGLSAASLVVYNGADYDPWMSDLIGALPRPERKTIVVADLIGKKTGDNPHIWYDPQTMPAFAKALAEQLSALDPAHAADYQQRLATFEKSLEPIHAKIASLKTRLAGVPVTATEPVFGYTLEALGTEVRNQAFQLAVMNGTEPSASDVAAFQDDLKNHKVKVLIYNSQASDPLADRMLSLAKEAQVPVVGATETEPPGTKFQDWVMGELDAIGKAVKE